jgi:hypothetical protein
MNAKSFLIVWVFILFSFFHSSAQYDYEKYPAIKYSQQKKWKIIKSDAHAVVYSVTFREFYKNHDALTLKYTYADDSAKSVLRLYRNKKYIQKFMVPGSDMEGLMDTVDMDDIVRIADINGDSLADVKIFIPNEIRCGAYNNYANVVYLFQDTTGKFTKIKYYDAFKSESDTNGDDINNRPERDFDGDGNYEIITQTFQGYKGHNYWVYNLYNYKNGKLVNVNDKADYPIMVQLLNRTNFSITNKLSRQQMKKFSAKHPEYSW